MAPSFLADECVFQGTIDFLRNRGFEVTRAQDLSLRGAPDREVLLRAQKLNLVLLTNDLEFGDIRRYPPSRHKGISVLKLKDYSSMADVHIVLQDLPTKEEHIAGSLFIVDRRRWRKRLRP
ncbi:hypothetical protein DRJ24_03725 [Candidatus Acetothermia bacterium]|nr:MAG: hypothetical protein DRJ24_03725 [Candidatus Acetothermia bacterium]